MAKGIVYAAFYGPNEWANYTIDGTTNTGDNGKNQIKATAAGTWQYDTAGNVLYDGRNLYAYDGAGRLCAVQGPGGAFGYVYDAEGDRVAKGTITPINPATQTLSCANTGFTLTESYVYAGNQLTTLDGSGNWIRTDVTIEGRLAATLDHGSSNNLHFHVTDAQGTRRVQTDPLGWPEEACTSGPFGDNLNCNTAANAPPSADEATPKHYTGKEHDSESGNDYFGARYYSSNMGRFLSPDYNDAQDDPEPVPYATFDDPQTLNLYAYGRNNPASNSDFDGHFVPVPSGCQVTTSSDGSQHMVCPAPVTLPSPTELENEITNWLFNKAVTAALNASTYSDKFDAALRQVFSCSCSQDGQQQQSDEQAPQIQQREITASDGQKIEGFTKHGIERAVGEGPAGTPGVRAGTKPEAILDALKKPIKIESGFDSAGRPFKQYTGEDAIVVVNPQTRMIVSTSPLSGAGAQ